MTTPMTDEMRRRVKNILDRRSKLSTNVFDPGAEIPGYLSYVPYLVMELQDAGRSDLADLVRQEGNFTRAEFDEIISAGLGLGSGIALEVAKRQRVAQVLTEAGGNAAKPGYFVEAVPHLFNEVLCLLDTHWVSQFEQRIYRNFEAKEQYGEFVNQVLTLEKDFPRIFEFTGRLGEFDDLAKFGFDQFLREYAEQLETATADDMDGLLEELPAEFQFAFDAQWRNRLEAEFRETYGDEWVEQVRGSEELWRAWEEALLPPARAFLMGVYSGDIHLGTRSNDDDEDLKPDLHVSDTGQASAKPKLGRIIDEDTMEFLLDEIARQGGDQELLDAVELQIRRGNERVRRDNSPE